MSSTEKYWLDSSQALLLVIDIQERLVPSMPSRIYQKVLGTVDFLAQSAQELKVPVVFTEQYPQGLGPTVAKLQGYRRSALVEKVSFGSCGEEDFLRTLQDSGRRQILVVGMEAHVCVLQTVLGLLAHGYPVHLVRDGIMARGKEDYRNALELASAAGAVVTTAETAVFQMLRSSTADSFKKISGLVKERFRNQGETP